MLLSLRRVGQGVCMELPVQKVCNSKPWEWLFSHQSLYRYFLTKAVQIWKWFELLVMQVIFIMFSRILDLFFHSMYLPPNNPIDWMQDCLPSSISPAPNRKAQDRGDSVIDGMKILKKFQTWTEWGLWEVQRWIQLYLSFYIALCMHVCIYADQKQWLYYSISRIYHDPTSLEKSLVSKKNLKLKNLRNALKWNYYLRCIHRLLLSEHSGWQVDLWESCKCLYVYVIWMQGKLEWIVF